MNNQLVTDSLGESSFSSSIHTIETISFDSSKVVQKEYPIPHRYYKDQLVLLPINSKKFYIYWEFTNNLLEQFNLEYATQIKLRVINSQSQTIKDIDCSGEVGEYFVNDLQYNSKIRVVAGYYKDGIFIEIMYSNKISPFNTEINYRNEDKLVYLKKEKGFTEIIRASLQHFTIGMSSASYVKEIERLQEVSKLSKDSLSSHTLGGK
jgi:hypothetical protein